MTEIKYLGVANATNNSGYKTEVKVHEHTLIADEPISVGGTDLGPSPGDYLCTALAACKTITLRMYVQRKQWDVGEIHVDVLLSKREDTTGPIHSFHGEISVTKAIDEQQKQRLIQIAKACPISKLLGHCAEIETVLVEKSY